NRKCQNLLAGSLGFRKITLPVSQIGKGRLHVQGIGVVDFRGGFGSTGCFSFFPSKNLGGAGDGGMITTRDSAIAGRLRILRQHGTRTKYNCELIGINSRLDALQAAILRVKLKYLSKWSAKMQDNANRYRTMFEDRR